MQSGRRAFPAAAKAGALGIGSVVLAMAAVPAAAAEPVTVAEPTHQELIEQIKALQSKVEQLEANQNEEARPPEARQPAPSTQAAGTGAPAPGPGATVDSVLRDAERRSNPVSMQAGDFTAGYSRGKFLIQDAAGNFVMNPNFQLQARYVFNRRDADTADPDDGEETVQDGFEIRRMKFAVDGNAFGPGLVYKLQWATNRSNGQLLLEEAWFRWSMGTALGEMSRDWAVRVGQFKDITFHEESTSSKRQLAVERSLMNEVIAGGLTDYEQGATLIWDDGADGLPLRAEIGYIDGPNSDNTNFTNGGGLPAGPYPALGSPSWGAVGRIEYLAFGTWRQYEDFTAMGNSENLFVLGAGANYSETGPGDVMFVTADAQFEADRLGLYAAYVGLYAEPEGGSVTNGGTYDWGLLVQAGYMLNDKWEVFGRYDHTFLDEERLADGVEDSFPEITIGLNYYIRGHAMKFTVDGVWLPNGTPNNQDGTGVLDPDGDETQFAVRGQFQLLL